MIINPLILHKESSKRYSADNDCRVRPIFFRHLRENLPQKPPQPRQRLQSLDETDYKPKDHEKRLTMRLKAAITKDLNIRQNA